VRYFVNRAPAMSTEVRDSAKHRENESEALKERGRDGGENVEGDPFHARSPPTFQPRLRPRAVAQKRNVRC